MTSARLVFAGLLLPSMLALLLVCCGTTGSSRPGSDGRPLSAAEARLAVREWIYEWKPTMNRNQEFPLVELSTPDTRAIGLQVFQVDGSQQILGYTTFVIHRGKAQPIGAGLGGFGVMSLLVSDLDADDRPELSYSYSWGSGVHRCYFAQWRPDETGDGGQELVSPTAFAGGDVRLVPSEDGGIDLVLAPYRPVMSWGDPAVPLGRLVMRSGPGGVALQVDQAARMDPTLRNQFWTR